MSLRELRAPLRPGQTRMIWDHFELVSFLEDHPHTDGILVCAHGLETMQELLIKMRNRWQELDPRIRSISYSALYGNNFTPYPWQAQWNHHPLIMFAPTFSDQPFHYTARVHADRGRRNTREDARRIRIAHFVERNLRDGFTQEGAQVEAVRDEAMRMETVRQVARNEREMARARAQRRAQRRQRMQERRNEERRQGQRRARRRRRYSSSSSSESSSQTDSS